MADTVQAGGLNYPVTADTSKFTAEMKKAEEAAKKAGAGMAEAFDDASKSAEKSVDSFAARMIDKTVAAIKTLQGVSQKMGEAWEAGSEGAEKAVTDGFNALFGKAEAGMEAVVAKIPGIWGKVGVGIYEVLKGSGALETGFNYLKTKTAAALDDMVAALEPGTDKVRTLFADLGKSTAKLGSDYGLLDESKLKESEAAVDSWAGSIKEKLDSLAEGARTALQKLAGTFTGVSDAVQKALDDINKRLERQAQLNELIGKSPGEQAALRTKIDLLQTLGKSWDDLNEAEQKATIETATRAANLAAEGEALRKAAQDEKERERTIVAVTASLQRQAQMQLANADALAKTAPTRALERAQAQAQGTGRKANVSDDPAVVAAQEGFAQSSQQAAQLKFKTEMTEALIKSEGAYRFQMAAIGATAGQTAALRFEEEQLNIARKTGTTLGLDEMEAIRKGMEQRAQEAQSIARATDAYRQFMDVGKTVASSLESAFAKFTQTGKMDFKSMVQSMLQDLERLAFRMALMPIFGGGTANSGGLLGSLFSSTFGGGKAEGGPLDQGKWYIAGEKGPEPIWGGGPGAFAAGYGGGGKSGGGGGGRSDINMTINLAGANGDETIAQIASQAARQAYAAAVEASRSSGPTWQASARKLAY